MQITYHNDSGFSVQISAFLFSSLTPACHAVAQQSIGGTPETFKSSICNAQSEIRNPQSAICDLQSAVPYSAWYLKYAAQVPSLETMQGP